MKRPGVILAVLLSLAWPCAPASAATVQEQFQQANALYWKGDFSGAARMYHQLIERYRLDNAQLYFNLANAHFKQDQLGAAVLYYKRALACDPDDETRSAIEPNLNRVREILRIRHQRTIKPGQLIYDESHGVWYGLFHVLPIDSLAILLLSVYGLLVLLLLLRHFWSSDRRRRVLRPIAYALFGVTVVCATLTIGNVLTTQDVQIGVVVRADGQLRSGRRPDAAAVALPEGLEVRLLSQPRDGWVRVQLSNGREGYVTEDTVKQI